MIDLPVFVVRQYSSDTPEVGNYVKFDTVETTNRWLEVFWLTERPVFVGGDDGLMPNPKTAVLDTAILYRVAGMDVRDGVAWVTLEQA